MNQKREETPADPEFPALRVVQVGVANFGRHRRKTLRQSGCFELLSVYDWNREAAEVAAAEEDCALAESYQALLETPGAEAVIISTGAAYHAEQVVLAARKGLHVFVEKPVCATPGEVRTLLDAERETGVVIAVGHAAHDRIADSLKIRSMIDSGEFGTVACAHKTTAHSGGFLIKPGDWRGDPLKNPGGMLFQCGVHGFHEMMFYFGPIVEVFASMRYDVHTTLTADVAVCSLRFASGLIGTLSAYHVTPYKHALDIFGTKANLYRDERFFDEGTVLKVQRVGANGAKEAIETLEVPKNPAADACGNLKNFFVAVRGGKPVYPSLQDGLRAVRIVFAAEESVRTNRPVRVSDLT